MKQQWYRPTVAQLVY